MLAGPKSNQVNFVISYIIAAYILFPGSPESFAINKWFLIDCLECNHLVSAVPTINGGDPSILLREL